MATYPQESGLDKKAPYHLQDEELFSPSEPATYYDDNGEEHYNAPAETAKDLVTEVIHAYDDPTLNPWTFRTWFLGV
jgi:hypothetical protein